MSVLASLTITVLTPVFVVSAVLFWMRPVLIGVLHERGTSADGAEYWFRTVAILALAGSLLLVLGFGPLGEHAGWAGDLRKVVLLSIAGAFISIGWIARILWRSRPASCDAAQAAQEHAS